MESCALFIFNMAAYIANAVNKAAKTCFQLLLTVCIISATKSSKRQPVMTDDGDDIISSSLSLPIQHSFQLGDQPEFTERGFLKFKSLTHGTGSYHQSSLLMFDEVNMLKELAANGGLYRARVPTQLLSLQTSEDIGYVSSYMKACSLLESNMSDEITIHADQSGHVLGISILPVKGTCTKSFEEISAMDLTTFNTTVTLSLVVPGPVPDTQAYLDKMEEERLQKKANGTDNRSFFAKYWMYIVPVVLFLMISGGQEQPRGGGGGGGGS